MIKDIVKEYGFESAAEFHKMISAIDISTTDKLLAFRTWKETDGTKEGLSKLETK
ncbi:MAG: hypothetical protein KAS32_04700 [Candidatus Peribacteraceae bacterium]|nr:hypothetical protein [Candidatus Peribacteraceae bacterium]